MNTSRTRKCIAALLLVVGLSTATVGITTLPAQADTGWGRK